MTEVHYTISDLHVGGDEQLERVDFPDELLGSLRELGERENAELVVDGDAFGLREFTQVRGPEKFGAFAERYPGLFEQHRAIGSRIPVTFVPGIHDYELAAHPEYVDWLPEYNAAPGREASTERNEPIEGQATDCGSVNGGTNGRLPTLMDSEP